MNPIEIAERISTISKDIKYLDGAIDEISIKRGKDKSRAFIYPQFGCFEKRVSWEFLCAYGQGDIKEKVTNYTLKIMRQRKKELEIELDDLCKRIK